jgi:hypothetical protein
LHSRAPPLRQRLQRRCETGGLHHRAEASTRVAHIGAPHRLHHLGDRVDAPCEVLGCVVRSLAQLDRDDEEVGLHPVVEEFSRDTPCALLGADELPLLLPQLGDGLLGTVCLSLQPTPGPAERRIEQEQEHKEAHEGRHGRRRIGPGASDVAQRRQGGLQRQ